MTTPELKEDSEIERVYNEYWKELVETDGKPDMDKIKRELHDYSFVLDEVPKVYCHITGNRLSKPNYHATTVIDEADKYYESLYQEEEP